MKRLCVNLLGGPNSGKTVAAANLFVQLKKLHIDCELVAEFPKDLVLEGNRTALTNQIYVFANQLYRIQCAYYNTKVSIVDSPLLLQAVYNPDTSIHLTNLVFEQYRKFNNLNIFMNRNLSFPHSMVGRIHTLAQSQEIDSQILELFTYHKIPYIYYEEIGEEDIISSIRELINDT